MSVDRKFLTVIAFSSAANQYTQDKCVFLPLIIVLFMTIAYFNRLSVALLIKVRFL